MSKTRVDKITGSFFRKGRCDLCGKQCERSRTFSGTTYATMQDRAKRWGEEPLMHRKCEQTLEGMNLLDAHRNPRPVEVVEPL